MKVLVVESDKQVIDTVTLAFMSGWPGTKIISTPEGAAGIVMAETEAPDIIILDIGISDMDGYRVLRQIRSLTDAPVIALTDISGESDELICLEKGADDYLTKPFSKMELLARVKTKLHRKNAGDDCSYLTCGLLSCELATRRFFYDGELLSLTVTETAILYHLIKQPGQVVRYARLIESVWGNRSSTTINALKVHVHHLRVKLKDSTENPCSILTWSGLGYSLASPEKS